MCSEEEKEAVRTDGGGVVLKRAKVCGLSLGRFARSNGDPSLLSNIYHSHHLPNISQAFRSL